MTRVLRGASGALVALALMVGSVTLVQASGAGVPNCVMRVPCPPPENGSAANVDEVAQAGDGYHRLVATAGRPNCLAAPCPPPTNQ